jgi:ribose/xylose/arabinose/galactoside ABC-type transport system permease subunit
MKEGGLLGLLTRKREYGVLALLLLVLIVVSAVNPSFLAAGNLRDLLIKAAPVVIVACGMTLVIVVGEIDISVGSMMGVLAAVLGALASTTQAGLPVAVAIPAVLLLGALLGGINGLLVTVGRVPSIIVTLGMLTLLKGITEIVMGGEWIKDLPPDLRWFGTGAVLGVPVPVLTAALVFGLCWLLARETPLGRRLYAVGGNPDAAHLLGLPVRPLKWFAFALTGFLTALATVVSVPQLSVIESGIGQGFELLVVTCVVVGGTSIRGGVGSLFGTLLAVLLLSMIGTVLIFLRLGEMSTYWERAIQGAFILLAVLADHYARRRGAKGGRA